MRNLFILVILIPVLSCKMEEDSTKETEAEKFETSFNKNIETYFLAEILSIEHRRTNRQWEDYKLKVCREYQPIVARALSKFGNLTQHNFVIETAKLNDTLGSFGFGNDVMMGILLEQPELGSSKEPSYFKLSRTNLKEDRKNRFEQLISNYLDSLYDFYRTEDIEEFFSDNADFYNGAIKEVKSHIPQGFTDAMEIYYGDSRERYIALVSPMMIWPIEANEGRGIGATVKNGNEKTVYEIMSPYVKVPVDSIRTEYDQFGFDYRPRARTLTIHEFGHSFVNSELEPYREQIESSAYLFTEKLKKAMKSKGVQNWNTYVIESFVRLGEIRIAEIQNDKKRANKLRDYHINEEHFVFLPKLESKVIEFENDREQYPMWKDFIPELLKVFDRHNAKFVDKRLD